MAFTSVHSSSINSFADGRFFDRLLTKDVSFCYFVLLKKKKEKRNRSDYYSGFVKSLVLLSMTPSLEWGALFTVSSAFSISRASSTSLAAVRIIS
jgi:hypothetical protein